MYCPSNTEHHEFEFHIRLEQGDDVIKVLDSAIESADDAHLTAYTCDDGKRSACPTNRDARVRPGFR